MRKLVVPLLEQEFNPAVAENLAELAEIARGEEDYWENEVSGWLGTTVQWSQPQWARAVTTGFVQISLAGPKAVSSQYADLRMKVDSAPWLVMNASVSRMWFLGEPIAVQRRLVKAIGENAGIPLEFKHVEEILRFAAEEGAVRQGTVAASRLEAGARAAKLALRDSRFARHRAARRTTSTNSLYPDESPFTKRLLHRSAAHSSGRGCGV